MHSRIGNRFAMMALSLCFTLCGTKHIIAQNWQGLQYGTNSRVSAIFTDSTGVYAGGYFTMANGSPANRIAHWNGTNWSNLGSGFSDVVFAIARYNGELYAGGVFSGNIAKWNGSNWSTVGTGANGGITALFVYNGNLYAGGAFTQIGGVSANRIARFDGSNWYAMGAGLDNTVQDIIFYDGSIVATGNFYYSGSTQVAHIATWNGSSWSGLGSGFNNNGQVLVIDSTNDDLYAGGFFTTAGGTSASRLAKWNGSAWSQISSASISDKVSGIFIRNSIIYIAGEFEFISSDTMHSVAYWNGYNWLQIGPGLGSVSTNNFAIDMEVLGNDLYVGGQFTYSGTSSNVVNNIGRWPIPDPPVALLSASDTFICAGEPVTFSSLSTGSPDYTRFMLPGSSAALSLEETVTVVYDTPGTYDVTLFVSNSGGVDTLILPEYIQVNAIPAIDAGPDSELCSGDSVELNGTGAGTVQWSPAATLSDPNILAPVATPVNSQWYYLYLLDSNGCENEDSLFVEVFPLPGVEAWPDTAVCPGTEITLFASGADSLLWSPQALFANPALSEQNLVVSSAQAITVTGTDANGCSATDSVLIEVHPVPTAAFAATDSTLNLFTNDSAFFLDLSQGATSWYWSFGDGQSDTVSDPVHFYSAIGTYTVTQMVWNEHGCADTLQLDEFIMVDYINGLTEEHTSEAAIRVFPNPTSGYVRIVSKEPLEGIIIWSALGKIYYECTHGCPTQLDFSAYPNGIYQVRITNESGISHYLPIALSK